MNIHVVDPLTQCDEVAVYYEEMVARTLKIATEARVAAGEEVRGLFGAGVHVDEMALMFQDRELMRYWIESAVKVPGVTLFNTAHDTVTTGPIPGRYSVHYSFLTPPTGYAGWRIEAMYAHSGSPLHDALRQQSADILLVHASFKCPDEEAYAVATNTLRGSDYELVQRCDSTYGKFSYWRTGDGDNGVLLKPRVNLRDAEADGE